jgi:hypothetical protein
MFFVSYEVFSNDLLAEACVKYFLLGGEAVAGPMSLLGGLKSSPSTLVAHFFAVALWGTVTNVTNSLQILYDATAIIIPLMQGCVVWFFVVFFLFFFFEKNFYLKENICCRHGPDRREKRLPQNYKTQENIDDKHVVCRMMISIR